MKYRDFGNTGKKVSVLGFGCMRFPLMDSKDNGSIDEKQSIEMIHHAIENGINYFDTAYFYHDGKSESFVGKALSNGWREKVYIATKAPFGDYKTKDDFWKTLDTQLERLQTDVIDFYLLHCVTKTSWQNSALKLGLIEEMQKAKKLGKISHIGFSFHDDFDVFKEVIDAFDWDFCQIQLNYIDVENQAGLKGMYYAAERNIPVIVMEPLLGGRLANLTPNVINALPEGKTPVESAFNFLWDFPENVMLLSGMSSMQQLKENLVFASNANANKLSKDEHKKFEKARYIFENQALVSCNTCAYCVPCPFGVDIPEVFTEYNRSVHSLKSAKENYKNIKGKANMCEACQLCEEKCPQHIKISEEMAKVVHVFGE